jgi:hypothetical protein
MPARIVATDDDWRSKRALRHGFVQCDAKLRLQRSIDQAYARREPLELDVPGGKLDESHSRFIGCKYL